MITPSGRPVDFRGALPGRSTGERPGVPCNPFPSRRCAMHRRLFLRDLNAVAGRSVAGSWVYQPIRPKAWRYHGDPGTGRDAAQTGQRRPIEHAGTEKPQNYDPEPAYPRRTTGVFLPTSRSTTRSSHSGSPFCKQRAMRALGDLTVAAVRPIIDVRSIPGWIS
jgi:hypothetical protein